MSHLTNSTDRRRKLADFIIFDFSTMRPCKACTRSQVLCVTVPFSEKCEQCTRFGRSCDLTSLIPQLKRLAQEKDRILEKILEKRRVIMEADVTVFRLRK
jgi:hypothetical protein